MTGRLTEQELAQQIDEERIAMRNAVAKNSAAKDRLVVSLSAATLGLSIPVASDLPRVASMEWVLICAWISLTVSVGSILKAHQMVNRFSIDQAKAHAAWLAGDRSRPVEPPDPARRSGRQRTKDACATLLSRYNLDDLCGPHQRKARITATGRLIRPKLEVKR